MIRIIKYEIRNFFHYFWVTSVLLIPPLVAWFATEAPLRSWLVPVVSVLWTCFVGFIGYKVWLISRHNYIYQNIEIIDQVWSNNMKNKKGDKAQVFPSQYSFVKVEVYKLVGERHVKVLKKDFLAEINARYLAVKTLVELYKEDDGRTVTEFPVVEESQEEELSVIEHGKWNEKDEEAILHILKAQNERLSKGGYFKQFELIEERDENIGVYKFIVMTNPLGLFDGIKIFVGDPVLKKGTMFICGELVPQSQNLTIEEGMDSFFEQIKVVFDDKIVFYAKNEFAPLKRIDLREVGALKRKKLTIENKFRGWSGRFVREILESSNI